jgi:hypothetical protein
MSHESKSSNLTSPDLKTWAQSSLDEASNASTTTSTPDHRSAITPQDPFSAARSRAKTTSSSLLSNPLFAKQSSTSVFTRFGPLGSLLEYAAQNDPSGADVLRAECLAFEACVRKVPNFSNISSSEMLQTIQSAVRKTAAAGELLLREGDSSGSMLYIHAGNVAVSSGSKGFIAHIYQDNIVGHHSYIYNRPRTATVHAATENNSGLIYYEFHVAEAQHVPSDNSVRKRGSISPTSQSPIASLAPFSSSLEQSLHSTADAAHHSPSAPAPSRGKRSSMSSLPSIDEGAPPCTMSFPSQLLCFIPVQLIYHHSYFSCAASRVSPRSAPPRRSVVAPGPGHAQLIATLSGANRAASSSGSGGGSPPASIAAKSPIFHVDVSEHHMWEEQQKSDEVARLNKVASVPLPSHRCSSDPPPPPFSPPAPSCTTVV